MLAGQGYERRATNERIRSGKLGTGFRRCDESGEWHMASARLGTGFRRCDESGE
jgi:hypothetical protein